MGNNITLQQKPNNERTNGIHKQQNNDTATKNRKSNSPEKPIDFLNNPEQQHNNKKTQPDANEPSQLKQLKRTLRKETQNTTPTKRIKLIPNEPENQQINQQKTTKQQKNTTTYKTAQNN